MDPDECLHQAASHLNDNEIDEAAERWEDYTEWTRNGGFQATEKTRRAFGAALLNWSTRNEPDQ